MKTLDLNLYGVQEMNQQEMMETDGGGLADYFIGYVVGKAIDGLVYCVKETTVRGTLMNMHQVDVKLWN